MLIKYLFSCAIPAIFVIAGPVSAYAGTLFSEPLDENVHVAEKHQTPIGTAVTGTSNITPIIKTTETPQKISCWQYGKLIMEQPVIAPKNKITDSRLLHNPETGAEILALDFKNAFCLIK